MNRKEKFAELPKQTAHFPKTTVNAILIVVVTIVLRFAFNLMSALIILVHLALFWLIANRICSAVKNISKKGSGINYAAIGAIVMTVIYMSVGYALANNVQRTNYSLSTSKFEGTLRIIQFADSHVGTTFSGKEFAEHVKTMQKQDPDVVCITGDFVDDDTSKQDMIDACAALGLFNTTYGVYYCFGNHDKGYYEDAYRGYGEADLVAELEKNGVTVLEDESILIDDTFYIISRSDARVPTRASMRDLTAPLDPRKYTIVLDHQPNDYAAEAAANVDLVLSGHTHGGQMLGVNVVVALANDNVYGYERRRNTDFIVTSGISDWAIRFKTGTKSEFNVIDVKGILDR